MKLKLLFKASLIYLSLFLFYVLCTLSFRYSSFQVTTKPINYLEPNKYNIKALNLDSDICLVNSNFYLDSTYVPSDLVSVEVFDIDYIKRDNQIYLKKSALVNLVSMLNEAKKQNFNICVFSGYRSYSYQEKLYLSNSDNYINPPGHSEHQLGLAVDLSLREVGLTLDFSKTLEFKWLEANSYKFGFILRYPKNKTHITGVCFEPWHFRYVGDISYEIKNEYTLEEYYQKYF